MLGERQYLVDVDLSSNDLLGELPRFKSAELQTLDVSRTQVRLPQAMLDLVPPRSAFGETTLSYDAAFYPARPLGTTWSVRYLSMDDCALDLEVRDFLHVLSAFPELPNLF